MLQRTVRAQHAPPPPMTGSFSLHEHVVHCADCISIGLGLGVSGSRAFPSFQPLSWDILHLSTGNLTTIIQATKVEFSYLQSLLLNSPTH